MKKTIELKATAGHLACFVAYAIFGVNVVTCKDLTGGNYLSPLAIFSLRALGAGIIFWILSVIIPSDRREKVAPRDFPTIILASFLGFFVTQCTFLMAIPQITPMTASIMSVLSPVYTMFIAAIAVKEPVTWKKAGGVLVSLAGVLFLIFNSVHGSGGSSVCENSTIGIVLMVLNGISFSLYLGIFRPLISRYSVITFMKWIFLFALVMSLPFTIRELIHVDWAAIPSVAYAELGFLVVFATFVSYFLIPIGQKYLRPTLVSMYNYLQPLLAAIISICVGMDVLNWQKVVSTVVIVSGVVIVSRSKSKAQIAQEGTK